VRSLQEDHQNQQSMVQPSKINLNPPNSVFEPLLTRGYFIGSAGCNCFPKF